MVAPLALLMLGGPLSPGMPAPELAVRKWVKGTPISSLAPTKIYVVEFWATWCGPCKTSIPHLTQLAKKNPEVTFIGVSVWEDAGPVKPFVDRMGAEMDYRVGWGGNQDGMAETWMKAAGQGGIPAAFVVKDGLVQWIGHPMELDGPLAKIKNGTFDIKAFRAGFDRAAASERRATAARDAVQAADTRFYNGDRVGAKVALAQALRDDPNQKDVVASVRFGWLASEDPKAWGTQAQRLARSRWSEERGRLLRFAVEKADYSGTRALARRAIAIALAADPKGFDALYAASQVYAATQAYGPALETTNKLLAYYPTGPVGGDEGFKRMLLQQKASLLGKLRSPR